MYTILKAVCTTNSYPFTYARTDFQNLEEPAEQEDVPHVFLDPVEVEEVYNEYDQLIQRRYSGRFMILVSSSHDAEDYDAKFLANIKPILDTTVRTVRRGLHDEDWLSIELWRLTEIINVTDYNYDGVIVNFSYVEDVNR